jgi:peptidyl-prolyl cis-trans isomerase B (cyclophilin B)
MTTVRLTTNRGDLVIQLYTAEAPKTVENFLTYVRQGFYDNTLFHSSVRGLFVAGGLLGPYMLKKATRAPIRSEANNGLKNTAHSVAMSRSRDPHSATAGFFINFADHEFLDHSAETIEGWGYTVFGKVVEGLGVLDQVERVSTKSVAGYRDVPAEDIVVQKAEVID